MSAKCQKCASSDQEVQSGLAHADAIAAVERARLTRLKVDNIIDDGAVDRPEVFDHESTTLSPDTSVPPRNFHASVMKHRLLRYALSVRVGRNAETTGSANRNDYRSLKVWIAYRSRRFSCDYGDLKV